MMLCELNVQCIGNSVRKSIGNRDFKPVGVLHSLTGPLSNSEVPVALSSLLAIEEINQLGGVRGYLLSPEIRDGRSNPQAFGEQCRDLHSRNVPVIFGCWASDCRKEVIHEVEDRKTALLFYPQQYEGVEASRYTVYLGAVPNQQIFPALEWCIENLPKKNDNFRIDIVGSDYVFPHLTSRLIRNHLPLARHEIKTHPFLPTVNSEGARSSELLDRIIQDIERRKPDIIINLINGIANSFFIKSLRNANVYPSSEGSPGTAIISFSMAENELEQAGVNLVQGDYVCWSYFDHINTSETNHFGYRFRQRFGSSHVTTEPMRNAYKAVYLWKKLVEDTHDHLSTVSGDLFGSKPLAFSALEIVNTIDRMAKEREGKPDIDEEIIPYLTLDKINGRVYLDPATRHCYKIPRVGQVITLEDRIHCKEVSKFTVPIPPKPMPDVDPDSWERFANMYAACDRIQGAQFENVIPSLREYIPVPPSGILNYVNDDQISSRFADLRESIRASEEANAIPHQMEKTIKKDFSKDEASLFVQHARRIQKSLADLKYKDRDIFEVVSRTPELQSLRFCMVKAKAVAERFNINGGQASRISLFDLVHFCLANFQHSVKINNQQVTELKQLSPIISDNARVTIEGGLGLNLFKEITKVSETSSEVDPIQHFITVDENNTRYAMIVNLKEGRANFEIDRLMYSDGNISRFFQSLLSFFDRNFIGTGKTKRVLVVGATFNRETEFVKSNWYDGISAYTWNDENRCRVTFIGRRTFSVGGQTHG